MTLTKCAAWQLESVLELLHRGENQTVCEADPGLTKIFDLPLVLYPDTFLYLTTCMLIWNPETLVHLYSTLFDERDLKSPISMSAQQTFPMETLTHQNGLHSPGAPEISNFIFLPRLRDPHGREPQDRISKKVRELCCALRNMVERV